MYVYGACLFYVCCSGSVLKIVISLGVLKYVCVRDVMFSICIVKREL